MMTPWSQKTKKPKKPAAPNEGNPNAQPGRTWSRKSRSSPRHSNTVRRVLLIASMAWEGRSASEIADTLGVSLQYVYQLCSDFRIRLIPKTKSQYAFRTVIELSSLTKLEKIAAERGDDVTDLVTRALNSLSGEPILLSNLLDDDEQGPKQKRNPRKPLTNTKIEDHHDDYDRAED